ncbi:hypothetical protein H4219_006305 [Mycoemilia scoparia]|uniref:Uncharacterized protein n=1 Tax=Mycoemilia scoparia TaxID=417184 RepID=A0A9W7ZKK7_9FUNG|nr:hypothetical protein H4219_006305 [Mycoemilia scoparia]
MIFPPPSNNHLVYTGIDIKKYPYMAQTLGRDGYIDFNASSHLFNPNFRVSSSQPTRGPAPTPRNGNGPRPSAAPQPTRAPPPGPSRGTVPAGGTRAGPRPAQPRK